MLCTHSDKLIPKNNYAVLTESEILLDTLNH